MEQGTKSSLDKNVETFNRAIVHEKVARTIHEHHEIRCSVNVKVEEKVYLGRHELPKVLVDKQID